MNFDTWKNFESEKEYNKSDVLNGIDHAILVTQNNMKKYSSLYEKFGVINNAITINYCSKFLEMLLDCKQSENFELQFKYIINLYKLKSRIYDLSEDTVSNFPESTMYLAYINRNVSDSFNVMYESCANLLGMYVKFCPELTLKEEDTLKRMMIFLGKVDNEA